MKTGRPPSITYEMGGHQFTVKQLASLAGCSVQTLGKRLERGTSPAHAVAMGKADRHRYGRPATAHPSAKMYAVGDHTLTVTQLAERAGCGRRTMLSRLRSMSAEKALALGKADLHRPRKLHFEIKPKDAPRPKPPKPIKVAVVKPTKELKTRTASADAISAADWRIAAAKKDRRFLAGVPGDAVITPRTKIVVMPAAPDRFAVDPATVPSIFGRIGQYEDTGTAIARQYR